MLIGRHWRSFSKQGYFDESGFFISTVLSTPMMVTQVVVLVNFFRLMVSMMIKTKRAQLRARAKKDE